MILRVFLGVLLGVAILVPVLPVQAANEGSQASETRSAYVTVAGAPGDGEKALAAAVTNRLTAAGLKAATAFEASVYEIQGTVRVTPASGINEKVRIVWVVFSPEGKQLGVVSQERFIRKGSLDRKWGGAADAAAQGAVADILKLLPRAD
ncbi:MAG: hypothetical protein ACR2J1_09180 [Methyloceanibacter sp.]|uniref:hypothetical protein n=1 Tax=Methyloceanibacter sp. TaxID=1965321 RepID=UPI003D9B330C